MLEVFVSMIHFGGDNFVALRPVTLNSIQLGQFKPVYRVFFHIFYKLIPCSMLLLNNLQKYEEMHSPRNKVLNTALLKGV